MNEVKTLASIIRPWFKSTCYPQKKQWKKQGQGTSRGHARLSDIFNDRRSCVQTFGTITVPPPMREIQPSQRTKGRAIPARKVDLSQNSKQKPALNYIFGTIVYSGLSAIVYSGLKTSNKANEQQRQTEHYILGENSLMCFQTHPLRTWTTQR